MNYYNFFKVLNNIDPICYIEHSTRIKVSEISKFNGFNELHFIPNTGGTKNKDINQFNAWFVDLDAVAIESKESLNLEEVEKQKIKMLEVINAFPLKPSSVVNTRNGLQIYWFINSNNAPTKYEWQKVEDYIVNYFAADPKVSSPSNQMRIPECLWVKEKSNPYLCKIISLESIYYSARDFDLSINPTHNYIFHNNKKSKSVVFKNIESIQKPECQQVTINNYAQLFDYLTRQIDMADYLNYFYSFDVSTTGNFLCIFHDDHTPSANLFYADSGIQLYKCFSDSCGFVGNIINVVQQLHNLPRHLALQKLCEDLNVSCVENEDHKNLLMNNIRALSDDIRYSHEALYGVAWRYLATLRQLHYTALKNLTYVPQNDTFYFSCSGRYLAKILNKRIATTLEDLSFLALLNFVKKADLSELDEDYRNMILRFKREKERHINVFAIPAYTLKHLCESEFVAKQIKEFGLRKKDFSYETVFRVFGKDIANRVFPQIKDKPMENIDALLKRTIKESVECNGYTTEELIKKHYKTAKVKFPSDKYIKQLPKILQELNFIRKKSNKAYVLNYNIETSGYPYIIIRRNS